MLTFGFELLRDGVAFGDPLNPTTPALGLFKAGLRPVALLEERLPVGFARRGFPIPSLSLDDEGPR